MDSMRAVALWLLATVEYGLAELSRANDRATMRRFLKQHPDVRFPRYPDGG